MIKRLTSGSEDRLCADDFPWLQKRADAAGVSIKKLGFTIELPEPQQQPRNPQLEARCQRLRREQEAREYRQMTKSVDAARRKEPEESIAFQMKQINRQLIWVGQFLLSVIAGFAFGVIGLELIFGELELGFRLLWGTFFSVVIGVAEIYFLLRHLHFSEFGIPEELGPNKKEPDGKPHQD
ncbi:Hypothetical predicted protein [Cloeon dipterum]|uniref:Uncharacterized protein n=1 Tax=Cloeon dipterum TaxID=197152 RepID=A0A8S1CXE7_9INSE|nr:Hypothetical predicted protein [Cloeon dipterum]